MSWNGEIPQRKFRIKGLRNKRNQKSPRAIAARLARREKLSKRPNRFDKGPSGSF
jgi:hypothetical protein